MTIEEWAKDFKSYVAELQLFRDDYKGIIKYIDEGLALLKEQPQIVRCKDCVHNGKVEKCVLAAIAAEKDYPLFMLNNCGEWFCADGKRR